MISKITNNLRKHFRIKYLLIPFFLLFWLEYRNSLKTYIPILILEMGSLLWAIIPKKYSNTLYRKHIEFPELQTIYIAFHITNQVYCNLAILQVLTLD